ncbi:MAG TPA: lytic transglycosylase [Persephonella sp.]|uniref:Membrane-bound lytic murein transglycosylase D n=1 Tax=Persephonella marina (strain DSM 14350 / EX-H1) TaxID=123214 RepID=C0QQC9_PERMH|nr:MULTISPECIES: LysM peptidoglycan-binding domain-containing protein [Persephonella]ACO04126.1 membrane-bound lytic murein transglycosylase D [Persephonella marina EX-H1]HCB69519.1 lytic transglycosylase [Persephonella sp.]
MGFPVRIVLGLFLLFGFAHSWSEDDYLNPDDIGVIIAIAIDASDATDLFEKSRGKVNLSLKMDFTEKADVNERIHFFKTKGFLQLKKYVERGKPYIPLIKKIFDRYGIPDELIFLPIIESRFNIKARSPAGAAGLWQFMPQTGRMYGLRINKWIDERYDIEKSTIAAAFYLKDLYHIFDDWMLALASYNTGEGIIIRKINKYGGINFWDIDEYLSRETRNYIPNFLAAVSVVKDILKEEHFDYETVHFDIIKVRKPVSLLYISELTGISLSTLKKMNPHLKKGVTPPDDGEYNIYIPEGYKETVEVALEKSPIVKYRALKEYTVKKGDSLYKIAKKFGTTVSYLRKINDLENSIIVRGTVLKVPSYIEAYPDYTDRILDLSEDIIYTPKGIIYKVKKGDTLGKIAKKFRVSVKAIKRWNRIDKFIYPNQRIVIYKKVRNMNVRDPHIVPRNVMYLKKKVKKRKPTIKYIFHKVRPGDTLIKIARKYGVRVSDIKKWNRLSSNIIVVGQKITIIKRVGAGS